jgi:adenylate cyclase class 2
MEHEVKLAFPDPEAARQAVLAAGGRLVVSRRLLDDRLFDAVDGRLRRTGTALRVRRDGARGVLTWKGPVQPGPVKSREEIETPVDDAQALQRVIEALGYRRIFHGQKYREEYHIDGATMTVDETPMGVFVEIEGAPESIPSLTARLGRTPADYILESYPTLWRRWCESNGLGARDMAFEDARA